MSNSDRADLRALSELEEIVKHLSDELASWRHRALTAEVDRKELGVAHDAVAAREQIVGLEGENAVLGERVAVARARVAELLERLRFLEEQIRMQEQTR